MEMFGRKDTPQTENNRVPVVTLGGKLGALSICRSLGKLGIDVHVVDEDPNCPAFHSRYCRHKHLFGFDQRKAGDYHQWLTDLGKQFDERPILMATSDELSIFVAERAPDLEELFRFPVMDANLVKGLASKKEMFDIAMQCDVPTAGAIFPENESEVIEFSKRATLPVMLKGIFGNRLADLSGKKMQIIYDAETLIKEYNSLAVLDPDNLMIQEYIPGGDDQIFIFNGYFDRNSDCLAAFTGRKIRQFPIHIGCASLAECCWNEEVSEITVQFMKRIGYRGILDIGYRYDERDGKYKVLDINPRVGQAFRAFVAENNMDVVRALYLDLTGQRPAQIVPREGRRWMIEDYDLISSFHYFKEGSLTMNEWVRSFSNLEEGMWFDWGDPLPFAHISMTTAKRALGYLRKKYNGVEPSASLS
jgi:D-aspartate ligase